MLKRWLRSRPILGSTEKFNATPVKISLNELINSFFGAISVREVLLSSKTVVVGTSLGLTESRKIRVWLYNEHPLLASINQLPKAPLVYLTENSLQGCERVSRLLSSTCRNTSLLDDCNATQESQLQPRTT